VTPCGSYISSQRASVLFTANVILNTEILVTLMMEEIRSAEASFLQDPQKQKQTPCPLVRKRTILTERRNLVSTFVDRGVSRGQRGGSPTVVNLRFLDRSRYFSFK
jgi:hypothetical protein